MKDHHKLLVEFELAMLTPAGRSDISLLGRLVSDDFVEVGANGRTFGKDEVAARLPSERGVSFRAENVMVKLLSPTVGLVTYMVARTADGAVTQSKRCSIWCLSQGQWQITYHQGTVA